MLKIITLTAMCALPLAVTVSSQPAYAGGNGGAVAAGVVGGLAAGAIIGSQVNRGYYNSGPGYYDSGYQPADSGCRTERQQVVDQYGNYRMRRVRVCD